MSGNVYEWCWDDYPRYYGYDRYICGGCLNTGESGCKVVSSYWFDGDRPGNRSNGLVFRIVRNIK